MLKTKIVLICIVLGFRFVFGIWGGQDKTNKFQQKRSLVYVWGGDVNCSGTLIHPRWVITSAHCFFYRASRERYKVWVVIAVLYFQGISERNYIDQYGMQTRRVGWIYQEMINVPGGRGREAALLKLEVKVKTRWDAARIQDWAIIPVVRGPFPPIAVEVVSQDLDGASEDESHDFGDELQWKLEALTRGDKVTRDLDDLTCFESGFGFNNYPSSATARFIRTWAKHSRICRELTTAPLYKEVCIGYPRGIGPCYGDWGSPLTCETKEFPDGVLIALSMRNVHRDGNFARPYHCARGDVVSVYTYLGAVYRWIRYYIPSLRKPEYMWVLSGDAEPPPGTKQEKKKRRGKKI